MDEVKEMIRAVINGQSAMRQEFEKRFDEVDKRFDQIEMKMDKRFKEVKDRLDKQGRHLAYLEDDAPTREEYDGLDNRLTKVEKKAASI